MKKRIIIIVVLIFAIFACILIQGFSNKNNAKMDFDLNEKETELIKKYALEYMSLIKNEEYEKAYSKLYNKDFSGIEAFKLYCSNRLIASESGVSIEKIKQLDEQEYLVTLKIYTPLFTPKELLEKENYKTKSIEIKLKLNGLFDYQVYMKEQYDG